MYLAAAVEPHGEPLDVVDEEVLQARHGGGLAAHANGGAACALLCLLALHAEHRCGE